jgi:hypothetical protein
VSDIFREINEEVRRDRFSQMVRRYWKYAAIAAVLAIGAAVAYVLIEQQADARREAEGARFMAALDELEQGSGDEAARAFSLLAAEGDAGYAAVAGLREAQALLDVGKRDAAVEAYDALSQLQTAEPLYRELAALFAAQLRFDLAPRSEIDERLSAVAQDGRPWRFLARELIALAALKAGDRAAARDGFAGLAEAAGATPALQARAAEMLELLGPAPGAGQ